MNQNIAKKPKPNKERKDPSTNHFRIPATNIHIEFIPQKHHFVDGDILPISECI